MKLSDVREDCAQRCFLENFEIVRLQNVTKRFGKIVALNDVSFSVRSCTIHALLGHNGAGKTTTLRLVVGLLKPDAGRVEVFGMDPYRNPRVRMCIGYVGENDGLYRDLTVYANLLRFCKVKIGDESLCKDEIEYVANLFELHDILNKKAGTLSAGNRRRVALARAFIGRPRLVILDEPLNRLDPVWRARVKRFVRDYVEKNGATVLYSTHILSDVEEIAEYVTILRRGRVVYHGTLSNLVSASTITVRIISRDKRVIELVSQAFPNNVDRIADDHVRLELRDVKEVHKLLSYLAEQRVDLELLEVRKLSLERMYLEYYSGEVGG